MTDGIGEEMLTIRMTGREKESDLNILRHTNRERGKKNKGKIER